MSPDYVNRAIEGYIECAFWVERDDDAEDQRHLAPKTIDQIRSDMEGFLGMKKVRFALEGLDAREVGHDFYLTRNRHGAGFWDRGLGKAGIILTEAAHSYGETHLYVGDDGLLHV